MIQGKKITIHPRPTIEEIDSVVQEIVVLPPGSERDTKLSQAWYLAMPEEIRNTIWRDSGYRQYFFEVQLSYPGWIEEDFSILHIAVTGETPIY